MSVIKEYLLKTEQGLELKVLNYGARVHSIKLPKNGEKINVALFYARLEDYLNDEFYIGATIGRFCNRLKGGEVSIGQKKYKLSINEIKNVNTLHGGFNGFDKYYWETISVSGHHVEFSLLSPHLDQGFPGNLEVRARYAVNGLEFSVEYFAVSDQDTIVNLCNHTYFNLDGFSSEQQSNITEHQLLLQAESFLPLTINNVPTGEIKPVSNTSFDFSDKNAHPAGKEIFTALNSQDSQITLTDGLDHTFVCDIQNSDQLEKIAQLYSHKTNIALSVYTTQNAVHIYTGNYLENTFIKNAGMCFETQGYADAPHHSHFPSALLKAGEIYTEKTVYYFNPNFL